VTATAGLTSDLQKQVLLLEDDFRIRLQGDPGRLADWQSEHVEAVKRERTASSWVEWRDDRVTQVAVAWVLTTVFVRFCEDNGLITPVWIAGPAMRRQEALDAQLAFFRTHPEDTDREWLQQSVDYLAGMPSTAALVDSHSALRSVSPSGDAATALLAFWRRKDDGGALVHDLTDAALSTRFLGDLYQDLSLYAKKTFALLQTPVFVEEFILDQTLEPALAERPLEGFRLIDPTCGSGHFLLGAFDRLLARWDRQAPGLEVQARVQQALDSIHGVDLNPFAVAITRFRLTVAALEACGLKSLEQAPAFKFHLAAGDSLLHGQDQHSMSFDNFDPDSALSGFAYATEDLALLREILQPGRYDVVVGNPPYITVKDKTLNKAYRELYKSCKGTYALTVPFMERFFNLTKPSTDSQAAGWNGQITSNSFMQREFGDRLIEEFISTVDLRFVINSEGAWIPGHNSDGTPTIILVGRNQKPVSSEVRAVLSKGRRETRGVGDSGGGPYWQSIVAHIDEPGHEDDWLTVANIQRDLLSRHPWSLSGGGAPKLLSAINEVCGQTLGEVVSGKIGFASFPGADDAFFADRASLRRRGVPPALVRPLISGDVVRDYVVRTGQCALVPYDENANLMPLHALGTSVRRQWPLRTVLDSVIGFEGQTRGDAEEPWWGWYRWVADRYRTPLSITFAEVATHNHFVLDRGGKVFKQTAPVIKLHSEATEEDHLSLLAVLNTSVACFWLKQRCKPKGGAAEHSWLRTYQFNSTNVSKFPLPAERPIEISQQLEQFSRMLASRSPDAVCGQGVPTVVRFSDARHEYELLLSKMMLAQEELDWEAYRLYGLVKGDLTYKGGDLVGLKHGERAFEIALARRLASGEEATTWFVEHGSKPITEIPAHWSKAYCELVQRRLDLIESDLSVRLLETPDYKRRWEGKPWDEQQTKALADWLLDRLEDGQFWFDRQGRPQSRSVAQLADEVAHDADLVSVLALWEGRPDVPISDSLVRLLSDEGVPFLAAYRLKDVGLRKHQAWEETWSLQRREDAGENVGLIPVPPKYESSDFRKATFSRQRGKLDVANERFILYPGAGRETDPTPLLGWAGWDHAQQSLALSLVIGAREADGWDDDRLVPLVAGLAELQPWVEQWHADVDPTYGVSLAAFCREQLTARMSQVGKSLQDLSAWRPASPTRGRRSNTGASS